MAFSPTVPDSIGALFDRGIPLRVACRNCGHVHDWNAATLLRRHGRNKRWAEAKVLCTQCESYGNDLQVAPLIQRLRIAA
jgi:hypothetical protein